MKEPKLAFVSQNKNGDYYVGYKIPVTRGIRGKTKGTVDELIIVGMNKSKFEEFKEKHKDDFKNN